MAKGFVYLCAIIDWHSRKVLAHRVSISMETDFCIDALQEAIEKYGCPESVFRHVIILRKQSYRTQQHSYRDC